MRRIAQHLAAYIHSADPLAAASNLIAVLAICLCALAVPAQAKAPKKVLVVTVTVGFPHSSVPTAEKVLTELGKSSGAFTVVDIVHSGPRPKDEAEAAQTWLREFGTELHRYTAQKPKRRRG